MKITIYIIQLLLLVITISCNLEKEIDINLPDYESRAVVECYLEPGQPFALLLSRSAAYFDTFPALDDKFLAKTLISDAKVTITHDGQVYQLQNTLIQNSYTGKVFNYYSPEFVPQDYDADFELKIVLANGKTIEATTRILHAVPIDSLVVEFEKNDTFARILTYLTDVPNQADFYRRMLHNTTLDSIPEQDFLLDDRIVKSGVLAFGTGYDYAVGDTVVNTIFHLEKAYYNFLESVFNSRDSNGNPFGQPNPIASNLRGTADALGIFTFLSYDRKTTIIKK